MNTSILFNRRPFSARHRLPALALALLATQPAIRAFARGAGTPEATPDWDEDALAADGLIGPNRYQSPHFGYVIEWSDDWGLRNAPTLPVQTLSDASDRLYLARPAGEAELWFISVAADGRTIQQRYVDATESLPEDTEVVTTLSLGQSVFWVEQTVPEDGDRQPSVTVNQMLSLDDGDALVIWFAAFVDELEEAFADVAGVFVDGEPVFSGFQVSVPGA